MLADSRRSAPLDAGDVSVAASLAWDYLTIETVRATD